MKFFSHYKKTIAQYLLGFFMVSTVLLPALAPVTAAAAAGDVTPGLTGDQANKDAAAMGSSNFKDDIDFGCFSTSPNGAGCLAMGTYYMLKFSYWIAGYMSIFFNFALNELVMGMGSLVKEMTGIMVAWKTIRDVTNVFLVFLTVYIGIATILGISGFGAKQLLWKVVLAALLVNFSVTFTKVIIDISNLTAVQIYAMFEKSYIAATGGGTGMSGCDVDTVTTGTSAVGTAINNNKCMTHGIAAAFWSQLHVTSIFKMDALTAQSGPKRPDIYWTMAYTFFMASVLFIVMAFAFGAAGILFVARFVILVFLLIMSPLALVLWITGVSSQGRVWWNSLLKQSIFPAAILLCWWIAYTILVSYAAKFTNTSLSEIGTPNPKGIAIASTFIIIIGFLIAGLILATKLGAYGAKTIMKTGENWSRKAGLAIGAGAGAVTLGAAAYAGRQTIGRKAASDVNNERLKTQATSSNFLTRNAAKAQLAASKKIAESSFDARSLTKSKLAGSAGGKGGYSAWSTKKIKETEELNKHVGTYKGTGRENREVNRSLKNVDKEHKAEYARINNDEETANNLDAAYTEEAEAYRASQRINNDPEQLAVANARLVKAQKATQKLKDEHAAKLEALEKKRLEAKEKIASDTANKYAEKGAMRAKQNLDRLSTEKTAFFLPTPQWKKDAVSKIRKEGGKSKTQRAIEDIISEKEETPPAPAPNPTPNP